MLKAEYVKTEGWEAAVRGMRNPMNSWAMSDSEFEWLKLGERDLGLMKTLVSAGSDHGKFMRMIGISMDITAPLYWWAQFDTYRIGVTRNSCSKMHKLMSKPFEMSDFSFDHLPGYKAEPKQFKPPVNEADEIWADYGDKYQISNMGRVKSFAFKEPRILSCSMHSDGYLFTTLYGEQRPVHRLIAEQFCDGHTKDRDYVNHKDGNKQNNAAANLEWVTQSENIIHSYANHLQPLSVNTYSGKFTAEEREKIKALYAEGNISKREIARRYGVSHTCINDIINGNHPYRTGVNTYEETARPLVQYLNELRDEYLVCEDPTRKQELWHSVMALLPQSYNQRSTVTLNYEVARRMYHARKNHKLSEWHELCGVFEELPYSELITMQGKGCGND